MMLETPRFALLTLDEKGLLLRNPRQFANQIIIVVRGGSVVGLLAALLAHVKDAQALSFVDLHPDRLHESTAFACTVARDLFIHMQGPEANRAMVTAAAIGVRPDLLAAFLAGEAFVDGDGIFS